MSKVHAQPRTTPAKTSQTPATAPLTDAQSTATAKPKSWLTPAPRDVSATRHPSGGNAKVQTAMKGLITAADAAPLTTPQPSAADLSGAPTMTVGGRTVTLVIHPANPQTNDPGSMSLWASGKPGDPAGSYRKLGDAKFPLNPLPNVLSNPHQALNGAGPASGYSVVVIGKTPFLLAPQTSTSPSELFSIG